jgi:hypothetical protein
MTLSDKQDDSEQKFQVKKKSTLKVTLITFVIIVSALACIWYFKGQTIQYYYLNARYNHFKINDKVYAPAYMLKDDHRFNVAVYQFARPMTESDIDALNIDTWKKALAKKELVKGEPYMVETDWEINAELLYKLKSSYIGNYKGYEIAEQYMNGRIFTGYFIMIDPNKQAVLKKGLDVIKLPKGYVWSDGGLYASAYDTDYKEFFKK